MAVARCLTFPELLILDTTATMGAVTLSAGAAILTLVPLLAHQIATIVIAALLVRIVVIIACVVTSIHRCFFRRHLKG